MLKSLTRTALAATALMLGSVGAHADNAKLKEFIFDVKSTLSKTVYVVSNSGERWDTVLPKNDEGYLPDDNFWAHMRLDTKWPGAVEVVAVVLGKCVGVQCKSFPLLWSENVAVRDYNNQRNFNVPHSMLRGTNTGLLTEGTSITEECNRGLSADGRNPERRFPFSFWTTFVANTDNRDLGKVNPAEAEEGPGIFRHPTEINHSKSREFTVNVVCMEFEIVKAPPPPRAGNTLHSIDLKVSQHGERCPKDVTVTAYANYRWQAKSRMRMAVDGGFPKARAVKTKKVTFAGKTFHRAEAQFKYKLDPGQKTFKLHVDGNEASKTETIEISCPPFKILNTWLNYQVAKTDACPRKVIETATFKTTRPGWVNYEIKHHGGMVVKQGKVTAKRQGNQYVATAVRELTVGEIDAQFMADVKGDPANSGWVPLKIGCMEALAGEITLTDPNGAACPRKATAAVNIRTDLAGPVSYKLDCTGGRSWQRTAMAQKMPTGKYVALDVLPFEVKGTEQVNCGLKSLIGGKTKLIALKGHHYQCITRNPDTAGGADDLSSGPNEPIDPGRPTQSLKGDFSFVDKGSPKCSRKARALINFTSPKAGNIHYSLDCTNGHFSGVAQTVKGKNGGFVAPALVSFDVTKTEHVSCALKSVAPGKPKVHTFKGHHFQCIGRNIDPASNDLVVDPKPDSNGANAVSGDFSGPSRVDKAKAEKRREAAKERRRKADEAAAAERKRKLKDAAAKRRRKADEAAAAERKRKRAKAERRRRDAAKKAAEARHKREARRKREAAKNQAEAAKKRAEQRRKRHKSAKVRPVRNGGAISSRVR